MTTYRRDVNRALTRSLAALATAEHLTTTGIDLPDELAAAITHAHAIEARRRDVPKLADRRRATLAVLAVDPDADIAALVDAEVRAAVEANTLLHAADEASRQCAQVLAANADAITERIRETLFDPALAVLTAAAAVAGNETPATLLRSGNTKAARALADVPTAAEQVALAYNLRSRVYAGSEIEQQICSTWRNPPDFTIADHDSRGDYWLAGIRARAELWFGTYTQVHDASRKVDEQRRRAKTALVA